MTNKALQEKYNKLTEDVQLLKIEKARLEERLERNEVEATKLEEEIFKATETTSIEEAKKVIEGIEAKLESKIKEAEELLGE